MWGSAAATVSRGIRGTKAIIVVFATVYTDDVLLNTVLELYKPDTRMEQDWAVDIIDKFVQAAATGVLYDHVLNSRLNSSAMATTWKWIRNRKRK